MRSPSDPAVPDDGASRAPIDLVALEPPTWWDQARERLDAARPLTVAGSLVACVVIGLLGWALLRPDPPRAEDVIPVASPTTGPAVAAPTSALSTAPSVLIVQAAGAVVSPGVYQLPSGARVTDLLTAAGGAAPDAELDRLNLAQPLVDGTRVFVPRRGEEPPPEVTVAGPGVADGGPGSSTSAVRPVDLNTATAAELDELPGVGPATAQAIIEHREQVGPFRSVDELLDVRGIGDAKLAELRPLVTV